MPPTDPAALIAEARSTHACSDRECSCIVSRLAERGREVELAYAAQMNAEETLEVETCRLAGQLASARAERDALRAVADDAHRDVASLRAEVERLRAWIASAPIGRSGQP